MSLNPRDPNLAKVELIAHVLGALREELVFVGGCAAGLLMSDPAAMAARVTYDVDLVAEVAALRGYHQMESEFSRLGFKRDVSPEAPICRWRYRDLEDIINIIDGRPELPGEIRDSTDELQTYLAEKCAALLALPNFTNYLPGLVTQDETHVQRVATVAARLQAIASLQRP